MKKIAGMIGLACLAWQGAALSGVERIETSAMGDVSIQADSLAKAHGAANVLIAFDVDSTLLTMKNEIGSDFWFAWQSDALKNPAKGEFWFLASSFDELLFNNGLILSFASMRTPEKNTAEVVSKLQRNGFPVIVATARGHEVQFETLRELYKNGMAFRKSSEALGKGSPVPWKPYDPKDVAEVYGFTAAEVGKLGLTKPSKLVGFSEGLYQLSGQHKGAMLRILLKKTGFAPNALVFVDDQEKNVQDVADGFESSTIQTKAIYYTHEKPRWDAFAKSNKSDLRRRWDQFRAAQDAHDPKKLQNAVQGVFQ